MNKQNVASKPSTATKIKFNRFRNAFTKEPAEQAELEWPELCDRLKRLSRTTAKRGDPETRKKELPAWTAGDLSEPYNNDANTRALTALPIDVDTAPEALIEVLEASCLDLFVYASPRDPNPDGTRRLRIVANLSRPVLFAEVEHARLALAEHLGIGPGQGVETAKAASQVMFAGRLHGTPERETWTFYGEPLDVDALIATPLEHTWKRTPAKAKATPRAAASVRATLHPAAAKRITAVVELVAPYYEQGDRRAFGRALAAWLANSGWTDPAIAELFRQLPSDQVPMRVSEALKEAAASRAGERVAGWNDLVRRLGEDAAALEGIAVPQFGNALERAREARRRAANTNRDPGGHGYAPPIPDDDKHAGHDPAVDYVIMQLAVPRAGVYQRAGLLVTITREAQADQDIIRPTGAPTIRQMVSARLKEIIRTVAGPRDAPLAGDVIARGEWSHIRPLDAIVTYPVLRRDGTILTTSGYDHSTRTLADMRVRVDVPDAPTLSDARAALAALTDLVSDFPFEAPAHRSAWLAALLTVPARPAIDGPTPMLMLDASARGSGKTMLADLISIITTGDDAPRRTAPDTAEEWRKVIYAMLLAGDPICLIDNVTRMLASAALDAMLTGTTYKDRVLGVSEERSIAVRTVMITSANNCRVSSDLVRRSIHCRLNPSVERPELRSGWRIPDLLAHVRRERAGLLGAALTIVRAYAVAGRPAVAARPMGSYDAWCRVVRDALVWAGGDDPAETQDALREDADVEQDELRDLLAAWHGLLGDKAVTVRELLAATWGSEPGARVTDPGGRFGGGTDEQIALRDALRGIMPNGVEPTAHALGKRLQTLRGGRSGGLVLRQAGDAGGGVKRWAVTSD